MEKYFPLLFVRKRKKNIFRKKCDFTFIQLQETSHGEAISDASSDEWEEASKRNNEIAFLQLGGEKNMGREDRQYGIYMVYNDVLGFNCKLLMQPTDADGGPQGEEGHMGALQWQKMVHK